MQQEQITAIGRCVVQQPNKATPGNLFWGPKHYEIPAYQRPYVWNEEDQWAPLWDDIVRVTESHLTEGMTPIASHFLGAVVFEAGPASAVGLMHLDVIDGQQRLTTLQILLDAVHEVFAAGGFVTEVQRLEALILNPEQTYQGRRERFKVWPSQANRAEFAHAMDPDNEPDPGERGQIQGAHDFFRREAARWLRGEPDDDGLVPPGDEAIRAAQLAETLVGRLVVVAIDLTGDDDAQLIFETLNDRGTPLLKADLIKNWVFSAGKRIGADVEKWSQRIWGDFDTDWWRGEITQGRMSRSRVDIFLHYWLTMRKRDEVKAEFVFRTFTDYAHPHMQDAASAEAFLLALRRDADTYRDFGSLGADTASGRFQARVIEAMELAATTPIFLFVVSQNHAVPEEQIEIGLAALESWVIRRTLLQKTSKDMNKLVVALLKALHGVDAERVGEVIREFLSQQTAETRLWPTDQELIEAIPGMKMYGNIRQSRIAVVLSAVEEFKRKQDAKYGSVTLPDGLTIEHIMPQKWREYWKTERPLTPEEEARRDRAVHTLGNLSLITQSLNSALSNRPWTDAEALGLSAGGQSGKGKWSILSQFNLIVLNKEILDGHADRWSEDDIEARSRDLATAITRVWSGPDMVVRDAAIRATLGAEVR